MAGALARGWGDPVLATDRGSGRARTLVAELGGEALASNREVAERADLLILAHKPAQLEAVADEVGEAARGIVVSIVGGATPSPSVEAPTRTRPSSACGRTAGRGAQGRAAVRRRPTSPRRRAPSRRCSRGSAPWSRSPRS